MPSGLVCSNPACAVVSDPPSAVLNRCILCERVQYCSAQCSTAHADDHAGHHAVAGLPLTAITVGTCPAAYSALV